MIERHHGGTCRRAGLLFLLWCALAMAARPAPGWAQDRAGGEITGRATGYDRSWFGFNASLGTAWQITSSREYTGYKTFKTGVFAEQETPPLLPFLSGVTCSLKTELRYAFLWGRIPLGTKQVPDVSQDEEQDLSTTLNIHQLSLLVTRRWTLLPSRPVRPLLHLGVGVSLMNRTAIERGTYHAFNFVGGSGVEVDIDPRWSMIAALNLEHASNGGNIGLTSRDVIGLESLDFLVEFRYSR